MLSSSDAGGGFAVEVAGEFGSTFPTPSSELFSLTSSSSSLVCEEGAASGVVVCGSDDSTSDFSDSGVSVVAGSDEAATLGVVSAESQGPEVKMVET